MANPARTWTISINNAFSSAVSRPVQYQEAVYNWKLNKVAAGWTVVLSSNGDVGANTPGGGASGAGDNWTSAAVIGIDDTAGGGAWIVLQAPAAFLQGGESLYAIGIVNDSTATPRIFQVLMSPTVYAGGSVTSLPTTVGPETAAITGGDDIFPVAVAAGTWNSWRSSRGDTIFMIKETGVNAIESVILFYSMTDADGGGQGSYRVVLHQDSGGALFQIAGFMGSNARTFNSAITIAEASVDAATLLTSVATGNLDYQNEVIATPVHAIVDQATRIRYLGQMVDITTGPANGAVTTLFGRLIDTEAAQDQRRVALGQVYFYVNRVDLPFV